MIIDQITHKEFIDKGWSGDKKYQITTFDGRTYLLRVSTPARLERRKSAFDQMQRVAALGIPMAKPVEFGTCDDGVYTIESWIDGTDAESVIPTLPPEKQHAYGFDAGRILKKLHSLPAPADAEDWETRFNWKIDRKIAMYDNCPLKYEGGEALLEYLASNRHLLRDRPQTYQHGDYHIGNMLIDRSGSLTILDFDKEDHGDPWEEFNRIVWCAQAAPAFASGLVDGYFDGQVPMEFWNLLALYICSNTLSSLPWAIPFGEEEIQTMRNQAQEVLGWYDHMRTTVPSWYHQ